MTIADLARGAANDSETSERVYRTPGFTLAGHRYTSAEAYDTDLGAVFGCTWLYVAAAAELPEPGDYVTVDVDRRSIVLVRGEDMAVRGFHNVCRHRGSRLLEEHSGCVGNIVFPYHQWTYGTDGSLLHAESAAPDFDRSGFGLRPVHVRAVAGLVFACLAEDPPADFEHFADTVTPYLAPHDLAHTKVAAQLDWFEDGNWKIVMENNRECAHCGGHPERARARCWPARSTCAMRAGSARARSRPARFCCAAAPRAVTS